MPTRVIRWLHLSDFHCKPDGSSAVLDACVTEVLHHIRTRWDQAGKPDFVFITGDIAATGQAAEYGYFKTKFLEPLGEIVGGNSDQRIFVVPGNHDVCRTEADMIFEEGRDVYKKYPNSMNPDQGGHKLRKQILPRFDSYRGAALPPGQSSWLEGQAGSWADVIDIADVRVGLLACNTSWFSKDEHDKGKITPGGLIIRNGLERINEADLKFVLGHHPLSWLEDNQEEQISELLGRAQAIFLHGHLHQSFSRNVDGGVGDFRVFASGAIFEPDPAPYVKDPLASRLNWGEADLDGGKIRLEPFKLSGTRWVLDLEAYGEKWIDSDRMRFIFPLPGWKPPVARETVPATSPPLPPEPKTSQEEVFRPPAGWSPITAQILARHKQSLSRTDALAYFDGMKPNWAIALSNAAPRLEMVAQVKARVGEAIRTPQRSVTLLNGPSGEGKSTLLLQCVAALLETGVILYILQQKEPGDSLPPALFEDLPKTDGNWLFVVDEADLIANDIYRGMVKLHASNRNDVHFLLAARDTAWLAAGAERLGWYGICHFRQHSVRGLREPDAEKLVSAWKEYGEDGLAALAQYDLGQAARELAERARQGSSTKDGALFGALLDVRYGPEGLKSRLFSLLEGFKDRWALPETSLLDAYAYIAAPHAMGLNVLTQDVLARVYKCRPGDVKGVLRQFGKEAFLAVPGRFITTRHQKIAKAACDLLREEFSLDLDQVYVDLVEAALVIRPSRYMPEIKEWDQLANEFMENGQPDLALRLIEAQRQVAPNDTYYLVKHSELLRRRGQPGDNEAAVQLFRNCGLRPRDDRGFWHEWSTAEGAAGRPALSTWLAAWSLADAAGGEPLDTKRSKTSLAGLGVAAMGLLLTTDDPAYARALAGLALLGPRVVVDDEITRGYLARYDRRAREKGQVIEDSEEAMAAIEAMIPLAYARREDDLEGKGVPPAGEFTFRGLRRILGLASS